MYCIERTDEEIEIFNETVDKNNCDIEIITRAIKVIESKKHEEYVFILCNLADIKKEQHKEDFFTLFAESYHKIERYNDLIRELDEIIGDKLNEIHSWI